MERAAEKARGLGLFVRSLVGLDREATKEAFGGYLDGARFDVHQVRFVELIVDESAVDDIVEILRDVEFRAQPRGA